MSKAQITVIVGALFLFVLLLFANKKPTALPKAADTQFEAHTHNLSDIRKQAVEKLNPAQITIIEQLEKASSEEQNNKRAFLDSLVKTWDQLKIPAMSAQYVRR